MSEHIIGYGKKVISDSSGTLYSSGGPDGPYNANEEDYFIIRRTSTEYASAKYFILNIATWNVADYNAVLDDYDYIDVYRNSNSAYDPSDWEWIERIGGLDLNGVSAAATFFLDARNIKFVFRSKYKQNYSYYGFKINFSTSNVSSGTDLETVGARTYVDQINLKENAGDSLNIVLNNVLQDPAKTNWDFIPAGQFSSDEEANTIDILNYQFTNFNYAVTKGKIPLSYTQPERSTTRLNSENISNIRKGKQ